MCLDSGNFREYYTIHEIKRYSNTLFAHRTGKMRYDPIALKKNRSLSGIERLSSSLNHTE
jgi:hypothetical protein